MNGDPKKSLALEALDRVREAEEKAKAIVREAREKTAVQIAREAAEEIKQRSLAEAKEEADAWKKAILARAHGEAEASELFLRPPLPEEEPPVVLENPAPARPFEIITSLYGLPGRGFIDPTMHLVRPETSPFGALTTRPCLVYY